MRQMLYGAIVGMAICLSTNVAVADNHGHGDQDGGPYAANDTAAYYGSVGDSLHYGPPPPPVEVYEIIEEILSDDDELSNEATEMLEHLLEMGELGEGGDPPPPLDIAPPRFTQTAPLFSGTPLTDPVAMLIWLPNWP